MLYICLHNSLSLEDEDMETNENKVGQVTHFFAGPSAAVLKLSAPLKVGDTIHIVGFTTDLTEKLTSMQIEHASVQQAKPGDDVAILVQDRVREGDEVFLVGEGGAAAAPAAKPAATPAAVSAAAAAPKPAAPKPAAAKKAPAKAKKKAAKKAKPKTKAKPKAKVKSKAKPKANKKAAKKAKPKAKAKKAKKKR
jgi:translation elongation factor EF-1alpha